MFANQMRGLRVVGTKFEYLSEGAYSVVFIDRQQGRIIKVFKAIHELDHCKKVFDAEVEAYGIAMRTAELKERVPQFHGVRQDLRIEDRSGKDVTAEFYPDLAYEAEFIADEFDKIATSPEAERLQRPFVQEARY